ncbi:MAG: flagellar hook capping FlgD N-terminal domain-containing protein [Bacillota bacterium]|nr:flagellar hook capping FlgD N-terminal domain-containing protein [Bacillota bacterium]
MSVNSASGVASSDTSNTDTRKVTKTLGKDEFLQILVAQLQNQDPLNPMDDTDFIAQMAQFSSLEQLMSMNTSISQNQAYDLVGKYIYTELKDDDGNTTTVAGKVDSAFVSDGTAYVMVGDNKVPYSNDITVIDDGSQSGITESILQSSGLIGKKVSAIYTDDKGNSTTITGTVNKVSINNGEVLVTVDDKQVNLSCVTEITE